LHRAGAPVMEFELTRSRDAALLRRLFRGDASIHFEYGPGGLLEGMIDSLGRRIRVEQDGRGRLRGLVLQRDRSGNPRTLLSGRYDRAGNLVEAVDPYKHAFRFAWDADNRMLSKTDRLGSPFRFEYDVQGRCVYSSGPDGQFEVRLRYLTAERVTVVTRGD